MIKQNLKNSILLKTSIPVNNNNKLNLKTKQKFTICIKIRRERETNLLKLNLYTEVR